MEQRYFYQQDNPIPFLWYLKTIFKVVKITLLKGGEFPNIQFVLFIREE